MSKIDEARALMARIKGIADGSIEATDDEKANIPEMLEDVKKLQADVKQASDIADAAKALDAILEETKTDLPDEKDTPAPGKFKNWQEYLLACAYAGLREPSARRVDPRLQKHKEEKQGGHEEKQMVESVGASGGFLVPTEFLAQLQAIQLEDSIVRSRATIIRMRRRQIDIPVLDQTGTATGRPNWFGGMRAWWAEEATAKTITTAAFRKIALVAHKLIMYTRSSDELLDDSAISISDFLAGPLGFAGCIAWNEDFAFIQGTGAGQPRGVINAPGTITVARAATATPIQYVDLVGMVEHFLPGGNGLWTVTQAGMSNLMTIVDPNGNYIWQPNAREGVPQTLFGMPIMFTEKQPQPGTVGDVLLCDWRYYLIGDRQATTVESTQFDQWSLDQTSWRAVHRVDGQPWLSAPMTLQDGTATVSPFVQLGAKAT